MAEQVGALIKKARVSADMTQVQLAEAVEGLSASNISKIERGLREPSDDELAAIAKATGVSLESLLGVATDEAPAAPAEAAAAPAVEGEGILELFNAADPAVKEAALSVLKGETQEKIDILGTILPVITEVLGSKEAGDNPIIPIIGFLGSEGGKTLIGSLMGTVSGMLQSKGSVGDGGQGGKANSGSILTFTFVYSVVIYILLLSFYFWQIRTDITSEK